MKQERVDPVEAMARALCNRFPMGVPWTAYREDAKAVLAELAPSPQAPTGPADQGEAAKLRAKQSGPLLTSIFHHDGNGNSRSVGYVQFSEECGPQAEEWREDIERRINAPEAEPKGSFIHPWDALQALKDRGAIYGYDVEAGETTYGVTLWYRINGAGDWVDSEYCPTLSEAVQAAVEKLPLGVRP